MVSVRRQLLLVFVCYLGIQKLDSFPNLTYINKLSNEVICTHPLTPLFRPFSRLLVQSRYSLPPRREGRTLKPLCHILYFHLTTKCLRVGGTNSRRRSPSCERKRGVGWGGLGVEVGRDGCHLERRVRGPSESTSAVYTNPPSGTITYDSPILTPWLT